MGAERTWGLCRDWSGRASQRVSLFNDRVRALRTAVDAWCAAMGGDERLHRFGTHFPVLETLFSRMFAELEKLAAGVEGSADVVYRELRDLETSLLRLELLFAWYADKYAQRLDAGKVDVLRAADEVILSCWTETFDGWDGPRPTGPLAFLESRTDPCSLVRAVVPSALRPPKAELAALIQRVPIPTIALPSHIVQEPWWLVLAAHETGHHICNDLTTLTAVQDRIADALPEDCPDVAQWNDWALELFADVYAVTMVGWASGWAVCELIYGPPAELVKRPGTSAYPAPLVRAALIGEAVRQAGVEDGRGFGAVEASALLDSTVGSILPSVGSAIERQLAAVPAVAETLLTHTLGAGTLLAGSALRPEWYAGDGQVERWASQLAGPEPVYRSADLARRPAARIAIAAGVTAYAELVQANAGGIPDEQARLLGANLVGLLTSCTTPGVLRQFGPAVDLDAVTESLIDQLIPRPADCAEEVAA